MCFNRNFFVVKISESILLQEIAGKPVQVTGAHWRHLLGLFGLNEAEGTLCSSFFRNGNMICGKAGDMVLSDCPLFSFFGILGYISCLLEG